MSTLGQRWQATQRQVLEDLVLVDLKKGLPYLKDAKRYAGEASGKERLEQVREALAGRTPAVLVMTAGAIYRTPNVQRTEFTRDLELQLYCCDASFESREAAALGDDLSIDGAGATPGVYRVMQDAVERLTRHQPASSIGLLIPSKEEPVIVDAELQVWLVTFSVDLDTTVPDRELEGVEDLEEIAGRVNLAPGSDNAIASGTGNNLSDNFARSGSTVTMTVAGMGAIADWVGLQLLIEGAKNANNNGFFDITAVPGSTQVQFVNGRGSPEVFGGTWKILPGPAAKMTVS